MAVAIFACRRYCVQRVTVPNLAAFNRFWKSFILGFWLSKYYDTMFRLKENLCINETFERSYMIQMIVSWCVTWFIFDILSDIGFVTKLCRLHRALFLEEMTKSNICGGDFGPKGQRIVLRAWNSNFNRVPNRGGGVREDREAQSLFLERISFQGMDKLKLQWGGINTAKRFISIDDENSLLP